MRCRARCGASRSARAWRAGSPGATGTTIHPAGLPAGASSRSLGTRGARSRRRRLTLRRAVRELRYEETTWKARPDWSPDGSRVVYSSYLGRQWNQLWLMTSEGGDVFPLTYGDFDATGPRWSHDAKRIAYISNEGGNTSLWVIDVPGGRRQRILATRRRYHAPVGRLRVEVVDRGGAPAPARGSVTRAQWRAGG